MSVRSSQSGFSVLWVVLVLLVLAAIGAASWYVWDKNQKKENTAATQQQQTDESPQDTKENEDLVSSYTSTLGGFTLEYPKGWILIGYKDGFEVNPLTGTEEQLRFQTLASQVKINNFGADLTINPEAPGDTPWPTFPNGNIVDELKNSIEVWQANNVQTWATGRSVNNCPSLRAASGDAFGFQLKSGKWLNFDGSFCWAQGLTTTYSYNQQVDSPQFKQAISILSSIKQN